MTKNQLILFIGRIAGAHLRAMEPSKERDEFVQELADAVMLVEMFVPKEAVYVNAPTAHIAATLGVLDGMKQGGAGPLLTAVPRPGTDGEGDFVWAFSNGRPGCRPCLNQQACQEADYCMGAVPSPRLIKRRAPK